MKKKILMSTLMAFSIGALASCGNANTTTTRELDVIPDDMEEMNEIEGRNVLESVQLSYNKESFKDSFKGKNLVTTEESLYYNEENLETLSYEKIVNYDTQSFKFTVHADITNMYAYDFDMAFIRDEASDSLDYDLYFSYEIKHELISGSGEITYDKGDIHKKYEDVVLSSSPSIEFGSILDPFQLNFTGSSMTFYGNMDHIQYVINGSAGKTYCYGTKDGIMEAMELQSKTYVAYYHSHLENAQEISISNKELYCDDTLNLWSNLPSYIGIYANQEYLFDSLAEFIEESI